MPEETLSRSAGERQQPRERVERFAEPIGRFADALDRFAGPNPPRTGRAGSVFGDLFAPEHVRRDPDAVGGSFFRSAVSVDPAPAPDPPARREPEAPHAAAGRSRAAQPEPPRRARPSGSGLAPPARFAGQAVSDAGAPFAAPSRDRFVSPAERGGPSLVFSEPDYPAENGPFEGFVAEPWLLNGQTSEAQRREERFVQPRSRVRRLLATVLFALVVIAAVLLFVFLVTPLLR